jgi:hypothetical protein
MKTNNLCNSREKKISAILQIRRDKWWEPLDQWSNVSIRECFLDVSEVYSVSIFSYMLRILTLWDILCHRSLLLVNDIERKRNLRNATYNFIQAAGKDKRIFSYIMYSKQRDKLGIWRSELILLRSKRSLFLSFLKKPLSCETVDATCKKTEGEIYTSSFIISVYRSISLCKRTWIIFLLWRVLMHNYQNGIH